MIRFFNHRLHKSTRHAAFISASFSIELFAYVFQNPPFRYLCRITFCRLVNILGYWAELRSLCRHLLLFLDGPQRQVMEVFLFGGFGGGFGWFQKEGKEGRLASRSKKMAMSFDYCNNFTPVHNYVKSMVATLCHICIRKIMTCSMIPLFGAPKSSPCLPLVPLVPSILHK